MDIKPKSYWTKNLCIKEAKKYKSRNDFKINSGGAYNASRREGWLEEVCQNMSSKLFLKYKIPQEDKKSTKFWTKKNCKLVAEKYQTRKDFTKYEASAYGEALKNGWLNEIASHQKLLHNKWTKEQILEYAKSCSNLTEFRKNNSIYFASRRHKLTESIKLLFPEPNYTKWGNKDEITKEAKKFNSRSEFRKKSKGAYESARKNGWLDDVYKEIPIKKNQWTFSVCLHEIKKYEYKGDFMRGSPGAYAACKKNSWHIDKIDKLKVKINRRWTPEAALILARKCKSRMEFRISYPNAYAISVRKNWEHIVMAHLPETKQKWNFEKCQKEAEIYKTRTEFNKGSGGAYMYAIKNKFLDEICGHMEIVGNEHKRMIYAYEFSDGYAYVGLTYNEKKRHYEHFYEKRGPVAKHIEKTGIEPIYKKLHDYVPKETAVKLEDTFINNYRRDGWKMFNGNKGGALGGNDRHWTFETCLDIAKNYNKKEDLRFAPGLGGLYNAARKNGWWNQICAHMTKGNVQWTKTEVLKAAKSCEFVGEFQKKYGAAYRAAKAGGYLGKVQSLLERKIQCWTHKSVEKEAKKYKRIVEFQKNNSGAYNYAHRNGLLQKVTAHMSKLTYWNLELCKNEAKKYDKKYDFMLFSGSC